MVVGGQHVSAALRRLYEAKRQRGIPDEDIETCLQQVEAEVIGPGCPVQLVKLGAGIHQKAQQDTHGTGSDEIFAMLSRTVATVVKQGQPGGILSDTDVYVALESLGLVKESALPASERKKNKPMPILVVCAGSDGAHTITCFFYHRRTILCNNTALWASWLQWPTWGAGLRMSYTGYGKSMGLPLGQKLSCSPPAL